MLDWQTDAKCRDYSDDYNIWFPEQNDHVSHKKARDICLGLGDLNPCPVLEHCRNHGIRFEQHGIWGGLSPEERKHIRRGTGLRILHMADVKGTGENETGNRAALYHNIRQFVADAEKRKSRGRAKHCDRTISETCDTGQSLGDSASAATTSPAPSTTTTDILPVIPSRVHTEPHCATGEPVSRECTDHACHCVARVAVPGERL